MKKYLFIFSTVLFILFSCGKDEEISSPPPPEGLTVVASNVSDSFVPSYLFVSGLSPKLICEEGIFNADKISREEIFFSGEKFTNCTLVFTSAEGRIVYTGLNTISVNGSSKVQLNSNLSISVLEGNIQLFPLTDNDSNGIADIYEGKKISLGGIVDDTPYDKTVIIVMEGDDLGALSLTSFLKNNYNDLVAGLQDNPTQNTKFVVIWDGEWKSGLDGNSDIFVLDPSSGKTFPTLDFDISSILFEDDPYNYYKSGVRFWFSLSDNLSNHLKELIEIVVRMYPAKSYDLILSDHGDGWTSLPTPTTRSVLFEYFTDESSSGITWLGTKQFVETVLLPLKSEGVNFELIGFDECLMGELSTLSLISPYAEVIVASPEYEPGDGWGKVYYYLPLWYEAIGDTWSIAKSIVDGYVEYYSENPIITSGSYTTIGLTAVKTSAVENLRSSFENFALSLKETALNEIYTGRLYNYFYSHFENGDTNTYFGTFWAGDSTDYNFSDEIANRLYNCTNPYSLFTDGNGAYHWFYSGTDYNGLGFDLLYTVTRIGFTARLSELGYTVDTISYGVVPYFDSNTVQSALDFLNTYTTVKDYDQLYTKYLTLNGDGTVNFNVTGSGLSIIYPYTSLNYDELPKLSLHSYLNFVDSYNSTLPNYTEFVREIFETMSKAVNGLNIN
ncbi:MAG: clostripain-related cysteine peptidase [Desulfurobacteriaceae bacterium]